MDKKKNELEEIDELYKRFLDLKDKNLTSIEKFEEIYLKNEQINIFNRRVIECNKKCIKNPEINKLLLEETYCFKKCFTEIKNIEKVSNKMMKNIFRVNNI